MAGTIIVNKGFIAQFGTSDGTGVLALNTSWGRCDRGSQTDRSLRLGRHHCEPDMWDDLLTIERWPMGRHHLHPLVGDSMFHAARLTLSVANRFGRKVAFYLAWFAFCMVS